jgi:hypothetical protein
MNVTYVSLNCRDRTRIASSCTGRTRLSSATSDGDEYDGGACKTCRGDKLLDQTSGRQLGLALSQSATINGLALRTKLVGASLCTTLGITALNAQRDCHPPAVPRSARADIGLWVRSTAQFKASLGSCQTNQHNSLPHSSFHRTFSGRYRQWLHTWTATDEVRMVSSIPAVVWSCAITNGARRQATHLSMAGRNMCMMMTRCNLEHTSFTNVPMLHSRNNFMEVHCHVPSS